MRARAEGSFPIPFLSTFCEATTDEGKVRGCRIRKTNGAERRIKGSPGMELRENNGTAPGSNRRHATWKLAGKESKRKARLYSLKSGPLQEGGNNMRWSRTNPDEQRGGKVKKSESWSDGMSGRRKKEERSAGRAKLAERNQVGRSNEERRKARERTSEAEPVRKMSMARRNTGGINK